jgi:hypothetical protein
MVPLERGGGGTFPLEKGGSEIPPGLPLEKGGDRIVPLERGGGGTFPLERGGGGTFALEKGGIEGRNEVTPLWVKGGEGGFFWAVSVGLNEVLWFRIDMDMLPPIPWDR